MDHVWDTADRNVETRARQYFPKHVRSGYDPMGYELVLKSPRAFQRCVAHEVAETLPPRRPTTPIAASGKKVVRLAPKQLK